MPEDVSIVGFDDTILASVTDPPLTTIAQPIEAMGKLAVDLVIAQLANKAEAKPEQVLKPELIVRKSTGVISK